MGERFAQPYCPHLFSAGKQHAELEKVRNPPHGGRPPLGRGDARSFSGGCTMPPPDYKHNTLGMDDLRKLRMSLVTLQALVLALSDLPHGSGRRNLGPGSGLNRTSDDSGNSA
ncbi:MIF4G-like type 3 [Lasiodiplodia theobromae]|uniref:MIF4G-like type 3 n=1 Tax=Lasiodiplodia theobromae TaxID=45133 RepID=A0A5N5DTB0_9PEZI|nr:hypothetical protein DBV05_g90 [Lasiodiplodia theobromae]KAF9629642.1 MIF4G-like type 3 [Lasiodiplodia theobromae]